VIACAECDAPIDGEPFVLHDDDCPIIAQGWCYCSRPACAACNERLDATAPIAGQVDIFGGEVAT